MQEKTPGQNQPEIDGPGKDGGQDDVGKKGGGEPGGERPIDEPMDVPGRKLPGVIKDPDPQPTI